MPSVDPFFEIRASRATPPGKAAADDQRRLTYGAALSQFDELMTTSANASPRSRPLPLFYAISQAGRAITAARAETQWKLRLHGLSAPDLTPADLCNVVIKPSPKESDETIDSFGGVTQATSSDPLTTPASMGALWSSLPGAGYLLADSSWPKPLSVRPDNKDIYELLFDFRHLNADLLGWQNDDDEGRQQEMQYYPALAGTRYESHKEWGVRIQWPTDTADFPGWHRTLDRIAPIDRLTEQRWIRPTIAGCALNPLMTWWALLYGLSMLARYEPAGWVKALDLDQPGLAAQLAKLLDIALEAVPLLVIQALTPLPRVTSTAP